MDNKSRHELDMTTGAIFPKLLVFALPIAISGILQLAFNAADTIVLGRFVGADALAAVGSTGSLNGLLVNFFIGLSVGVNIVVARNYAAKKYESVSRIVHTSIGLSILCGIFMTCIGLPLINPMLRLMGSPEEILPMSALYMRIYFLGFPFILLNNFGSAVLRSIGDTRRPLYYLTAAGVINVILNLVFTLQFHMGVAGVAIATTASHVISSLLVLRALMKEDSCIHVDLKKLNLDGNTILEFAKVGVPAGIQSTLFNISNVMIQSSVNSFGATVMAGSSAGTNLYTFWYTAMHCFYTACITFVSQNIGAKRYSRIDKIVYSSLLAELLVGGIFALLYTLFKEELLSLYTTDPEVIAVGIVKMDIFNATYTLCGLMDVGAAAIRGMGYGTLPTVISVFGAVGLRILWLYTVFAMFPTYPVLMWGYSVSWLIQFIISMVAYFIVRKRLPREDELQAA